MNIQLRLEEKKDEKKIDILTREAFWLEERIEKLGIGCDEHYLTHILRQCDDFIKELNFVAEVEGKLVGNIMYTKATVIDDKEHKHNVIIFGPISVLPEFQKTGIGSALMKHSIEAAKKLGYNAILLFGHPSYYPRFGFKEAKEFNITTRDGKNFPAFMAMELFKDALEDISGKFYESPAYEIDIKDVIKYDKELMNESL